MASRIYQGYIYEQAADGSWQRKGPAAPQMPADPTYPMQVPKIQADIAGTQVSTQGKTLDNEITAATKDATITKATNDAISSGRTAATAGAPEGQMWNEAGTALIPIPGYKPKASPDQANADRDRISRLNQLIAQINRTQELFDQGPGKTKGPASLRDYLPTDANAAFDTAGAALSQQGLAAFRVPGTGTVSDRDAIMFDRANLPTAATRDAAVREQLRGLRSRVDEELRALGVAPAAWTGSIPEDEKQDRERMYAAMGSGGNSGTVWQQPYATPGAPPGAAPFGATTQGQPIDPKMQAELDAYIQQNGKNITPQGLSQFISGLYGKYGGAPGAGLDDYANVTADRLRTGGQINTNIPPQTVPLSGVDKFRNDLVNNPIGAGLAGFTDAASMGGVSLLAPDEMGAIADASTGNAVGMGLGQMAGAITGTGALGAAARGTVGRLPYAMSGGAKARLARSLGTDALYSGIYGTAQGGDPFASAAIGTAGSLAGRGIGNVAGRAIGGLELPVAVQALRARGIPTTTGQSIGGLGKSVEDAMTSIPGIGDLVNARRLEGFQAFNRAAFDEAGAPIGYTPTGTGRAGLADLFGPEGTMGQGAISRAYDDATRGVSVPLDPQFNVDMSNIARARSRLPNDYAARFDKVGENRIGPIVDDGVLTGEGYQQAMRGLKGSRASASGAAPGFEQEYRDALSSAMDALKGQMQRGGGQSVLEGLARADQANRLGKTLKDAVGRAKGGSGSGEIQVFTPSQLMGASEATMRKYPGARPFADLADAGQSVLPSSLPDSGTARRVAQMAMPAALGGGAGGIGAGVGYLAGGTEGAQSGALTGLALAAALGLGGTKGGQKALDNVLFVRPDAVRRAGQAIGRRSGMFGRSLIPLSIPILAAP